MWGVWRGGSGVQREKGGGKGSKKEKVYTNSFGSERSSKGGHQFRKSRHEAKVFKEGLLKVLRRAWEKYRIQ